jgi:Na+-transporting NADH:ubiquinone oxidoreductase subunit NqrB
MGISMIQRIWEKFWDSDVRIVQACLMGILLLVGVWIKDFSIFGLQILATFTSGLLTQYIWIRIRRLDQNSIFSALITCLGLSLLLRSDNLWVHPTIACIVISSKFILKIQGKHLFNPAMLGVVLGVKLFPGAWISPGQWGDEILVSCFLLLFGLIVSNRVNIQDISIAFASTYISLLALRTIHYGYEWKVFLHQISNGSLLLFTFFMITDPRTAPNHLFARILHGIAVALFAHIWQFIFYKPAGIIWGLFFMTPLVPIWDRIFAYRIFEWKNINKGLNYEKSKIYTESTNNSNIALHSV